MDPLMLVLLGFLGAFAGFLGGMLGVGGGVIVVPVLVLAFSLDTRIAVGTSLLMITFTALSGSYAYYLQRRIDWKVGIISALFTVPGASLRVCDEVLQLKLACVNLRSSTLFDCGCIVETFLWGRCG